MRITAAVLILASAACSKEEEEKPAAPAPAPVTSPAGAPAPALQPVPEWKAGEVQVSLSINDALRPLVYRGWPLRATVDVDPPGSSAAVLETAGAAWPWTPQGKAWVLTAEQTAALAAGRYRVRATAAGAWAEVELELQDEPATLSAEQKREKLVRQAGSVGAAQAVELARRHRGGDAEDLTSWLVEGDALMLLERKAEAAEAYRQALALHRRANPMAKEDPAPLRRRLAAATGR